MDIADDLAVGGPVVEIAPTFGVVFGEGVVESSGAGLCVGGEVVAGLQPRGVQGVEPVECGMQDAELVTSVVLSRVGGQLRELGLGRGQQVTGAGADGLERSGCVGVAPTRAQPVGVVVIGPVVEVGVLVGVRFPGFEDALAVAEEAVEVVQELAVSSDVEGNGEVPSRGQR
ncbi:hypothetical protein ACFV1B_14870 [Streptomyces sp. NPDC059637]|uniref:hypothetical protein n=1 Tax=Streptomyces sp. NPDC059637 TaxID=3347752 RepID=UPI0036CFBE35